MTLPIEDYAIIGDCHSAALVGKNGSIDWLCLPRFDSDAAFAALLGGPEHGRWIIAPSAAAASPGEATRVRRAYRHGTLVLETRFETDEGAVTIVDFMPVRGVTPHVVRIVVGESGVVSMRTELVIRLMYGSVVPWVRAVPGGIQAIAGPDRLRLLAPIETRGEDMKTVADFTVRAGDRIPFVLSWSPSHRPPPDAIDPEKALADTEETWRAWSATCDGAPEHADIVRRSLITLKALTYTPTGGIVAAPTTSLPEAIGGVRNWDYRFCWLRDATFTLYALMSSGHLEEAAAWRDWLLRAIAGDPAQIQIMYGIAGERRMPELELTWLPGYEASRPVRTGNAAAQQLQLDVFGEVMDTLHLGRKLGLPPDDAEWPLQRSLIAYLAKIWREPDAGMWEVRGPRRHFVHSKVMAWVAFDRAVKGVEQFGLEGPADEWRATRDEIHAWVCNNGFDAELDSFVQFAGSKDVDASLLLMPMVGFLPPDDPRLIGTVRAIETTLVVDGLVQRYPTRPHVDGLPSGEGAFIACSFWLADCYALQGRHDDARALFDRLAALANDVGLIAEEYDPRTKRLVGNFPQAFSHVALVNSAHNLARAGGPASHRRQ